MSDDLTRWESVLQFATDEQYAWIRENCGEEAANLANYGWATDGTEEPLLVGVATKVYGHGILETVVREDVSGLQVTHKFEPFDAPS
jgi:hypothetical protein